MTESPTSGKGVGTGFLSGPLMEHFRCPQPLTITGYVSPCHAYGGPSRCRSQPALVRKLGKLRFREIQASCSR